MKAEDFDAQLAKAIESGELPEDAEPELIKAFRAQQRIEDLFARLAPPAAESTNARQSPEETLVQAGDLVGQPATRDSRYTVLRPHAKGGIGEVFVAHDEELNREVALKELQPRFADDATSRNRFLLEGELTGGLEHPGVVPVYGLGQYPDGRPFYAMRFIRGDSLQDAITRFHGDNQETSKSGKYESVEFRKLLSRFVDVCNAIAYAHSRGVLHRDLKPSNVMLGDFGETLVVDWGLAKLNHDEGDHGSGESKALHPKTGNAAGNTEMGSIVGTPAFMSPEQARGDLDDIGPASDIYSLGATLYCLLTGQTPFNSKNVGEVIRNVDAGDFPRPREIKSEIPKPLEAVCLMAMSRGPRQRYATPQGLAEELERYLADEPVLAHTEPIIVRSRRWLRKHPKTVAGLAATLLVGLTSALAIAAVVSAKNDQLAEANNSLVAANQAERSAKESERSAKEEAQAQRDRAQQAERLARTNEAEAKRQEAEAKEQEAAAKRSAEEAKAVLDFFEVRVLAAARPQGQQGGLGVDVTIRAAVDAAEPSIAASFADQPLVEASIRNMLGLTYSQLGETELAILQYERALEIRRNSLGVDHPDTLTAMSNLASEYGNAGRFDEGLSLHEEALKLAKAKSGLEHSVMVMTMNNLASAYGNAGRLDEGLSLHEEALNLAKAKLGPEHFVTLGIMNNLASAYDDADRPNDAISLYKTTLKLRKDNLGAAHPNTLTTMDNLAGIYAIEGRLDEALLLHEETLKLRKVILGADHPDTLTSMNNLAATYGKAGRVGEALHLLEETYKLKKDKLGADHPDTLSTMNNLAYAYTRVARLDEALLLFDETLKLRKDKLGADHPDTLSTMNELANAYAGVGRLGEALLLQEEALKLRKTKLGADHRDTIISMNNLANTYKRAGRLGEALLLDEETLKLTKKKLGPEHPDTLTSMNNVAYGYTGAARLEEAMVLFDETLKLRKAELGPKHPDTLMSMNNLAMAYGMTGQLEEAVKLHEETLKLRRASQGINHPHTVSSMINLATTYLSAKQSEQALSMFEQYFAVVRPRVKPEDPELALALALISLELLKHQQYAAAETYLRECLTIREKQLPDHWLLYNTQSMLGNALYGRAMQLLETDRLAAQKKIVEAESLLLSGYKGLDERKDQIPAGSKVRLTEAAKRLVDLYIARGNAAEAARWKKRLEDLEVNLIIERP